MGCGRRPVAPLFGSNYLNSHVQEHGDRWCSDVPFIGILSLQVETDPSMLQSVPIPLASLEHVFSALCLEGPPNSVLQLATCLYSACDDDGALAVAVAPRD